MKSNVITILVCLAITFVAVAWGSNKQQPDNSASNWEYKVTTQMSLAGIKSMDQWLEKAFEAKSYEGSEKLNAEMSSYMTKLGDQGWELVCYSKETGFVFKRPR